MKLKRLVLHFVLFGALVLGCSCEKEVTDDGGNIEGGEEVVGDPVISSYFTKFDNKAVYDDKMTITGKNFAKDKSGNIVTFNDVKASILSASATELTVKVPRIEEPHAVICVEVDGNKSNRRAVYYDRRRCDSVLLFQGAKVELLRTGVEWKQLITTWHDAPRSINVVSITPSSQNRLGLELPSSLATTSNTSKAVDALVGINASYFGDISRGFVRINGIDRCPGDTYADSKYYLNNGVFVFNDNVPGIKAVENNAAAAKLSDKNIQCCGPLLILDGVDQPQADVSHCTDTHPRTIVGVTEDGRVLFVVVDGRFEGKAVGMSTTMLQELMYLMGAKHALNLDGGGSSTMYIKDKGVVNHVCNSGSTWDKVSERKVSTILYVK